MSNISKTAFPLLAVVGFVVLASACGPSAADIQRAIEQTQATQPTLTLTPASTDTPLPTDINTPKPTNTPRPTATKTRVPTSTSTSTPAPKPILLTGSGDGVVDVDRRSYGAVARVTHSGRGNFAVWNYGPDGKKIDLLVNTIGVYSGTVPIDFFTYEYTTRFEITASGDWTIEIIPLTASDFVFAPTTLNGIGDNVITITPKTGTKIDLLKIDASKADSNFTIWAYGENGRLLVKEIAPYSGTVVVPTVATVSSTYSILVIHATGEWSIEVTTR